MTAPARRTEIAQTLAATRAERDALVRALYDTPEVGFEEHIAASTIAAVVERHGIPVERGAYGLPTALRAHLGGSSGPHVAILAEYDALPGIGHACGHNIIAAIAVGAFVAVAPHVQALGGRVTLIGTPAEENGGGKELILRAGGFDDVDAAVMVHPTAGSAVSSVVGERTTGVRRVAVTYRGRAAHAAGAPWRGRNALDAVVTAYQGVAQLRQHILPTDRIHGIITDGGAAPNVVPEQASALFYVRSAEVDELRELTDRVVAVLEGAAQITGTRPEIDVDPVPPYLPLRTNVALSARYAEAIAHRGRIVPPSPAVPPQGGPSTDMGNVSQFVPSIHPTIGLGGPADVFPHNAAFAELTLHDSARDAREDAAAALAATVADYLADAELREAVAAEFAAAGGAYRWPR